MYVEMRPLPGTVHHESLLLRSLASGLKTIEDTIAAVGGVLDLNPDFQRGHVWSREQQIRFVEAVCRGTAPMKVIFNSPSYGRDGSLGDLNQYDVLCVDGLQRLTAVMSFMRGEFKIFGKWAVEDLDGTSFSFHRHQFKFDLYIYAFKNRKDLLSFYIDLNSGGTVHSKEELDRVRALVGRSLPDELC